MYSAYLQTPTSKAIRGILHNTKPIKMFLAKKFLEQERLKPVFECNSNNKTLSNLQTFF